MDDISRSLFDEQETLLADVKHGLNSISPSKIFGDAISVMNLIEGFMAGERRENVVTTNPDVAYSRTVKLLDRLDAGDEKSLSAAELLSAKLLRRPEPGWGAKVARVLILGSFLGFKLATKERIYSMVADSRAKKFWSDLKTSAETELSP